MHNCCITQMLQMLLLPSYSLLVLFAGNRELQLKCFMIIKCGRQLSADSV